MFSSALEYKNIKSTVNETGTMVVYNIRVMPIKTLYWAKHMVCITGPAIQSYFLNIFKSNIKIY